MQIHNNLSHLTELLQFAFKVLAIVQKTLHQAPTQELIPNASNATAVKCCTSHVRDITLILIYLFFPLNFLESE